MSFSQLLGNEQLKNRLSQTFGAGKSSHCYLICGAVGSGRKTLAKLLTAAFQCTGADAPCLTCSGCKKALSGNHPDLILVDDPDKVNVGVDLIRSIHGQVYIKPNEGKKQVVYIPRADKMNESAQNALLKLIEEPPSFGAFLLVADRAEALLPTIRSRCVTLRMSPLPRNILEDALIQRYPSASATQVSTAGGHSGGFLGQALDFMELEHPLTPVVCQIMEAYARQDMLTVLSLFPQLERKKRDELLIILEEMRLLAGEGLALSQGRTSFYPQATLLAQGRTAAQLFALCGHLHTAWLDCSRNINGGNVLANLHAAL